MAGIVEQIGAMWWSAVAVAAIKSTFILGMAGLVVWTMRRRSPAVRFRVWLGGFFSAALLPVLSAVSPDLPWLPSWLARSPLTSSAVLNPKWRHHPFRVSRLLA